MRNEFKQFITVLALSIALICAGYLSGRAQTTQTAENTVKTIKTCKGMTKAGEPCKATMIIKGTEFCNAHNPDAIKCSGQTSKKEPCKMTVKVAGLFCRFHEATKP